MISVLYLKHPKNKQNTSENQKYKKKCTQHRWSPVVTVLTTGGHRTRSLQVPVHCTVLTTGAYIRLDRCTHRYRTHHCTEYAILSPPVTISYSPLHLTMSYALYSCTTVLTTVLTTGVVGPLPTDNDGQVRCTYDHDHECMHIARYQSCLW